MIGATMREYARIKHEKWTRYIKTASLVIAVLAALVFGTVLFLAIVTSGIWVPVTVANIASSHVSDRATLLIWLGATVGYMLIWLGVTSWLGGDLRTAIEEAE